MEQVIELSVEETNQLRTQLGLAPLRTLSSPPQAPSVRTATAPPHDEEDRTILELSVEDSNVLRVKLGLAPLRNNHSTKQQQPALVMHQQQQLDHDEQQRKDRAQLQQQVQEGISKFAQNSLTADDDNEASAVLSWAQQMRRQQQQQRAPQHPAITLTKQRASVQQQRYDANDLQGLNVSHAVSELEQGSTILTLVDASVLQTATDHSAKVLGLNDGQEDALQNVSLSEQQQQHRGLQAKRKYEMGMGRAGGYAGYDDDEFEELGGSQAPSRVARSGAARDDESQHQQQQTKGFQIGTTSAEHDAMVEESDFVRALKGKTISLESTWGADGVASDYMTTEEAKAQRRARKETKFNTNRKKKKSRKSKTKVQSDDDDEDGVNLPPSKGLLEQLEESAGSFQAEGRKRRRSEDEQESSHEHLLPSIAKLEREGKDKRAKFDAIMAKGNERTLAAFQSKKPPPVPEFDEEPDDAFLNAALSKARRLQKLKEMSESKPVIARGEDVVLKAVQAAQRAVKPDTSTSGTVTFSINETQAFTRALQARAEQVGRQEAKKAVKAEGDQRPSDATETDAVMVTSVKQEESDEDVDMEELVKEVERNDTDSALDGGTGTVSTMGRGLGGVLGLLKQTGELSRKNAGKEEMRGRAKDKRTYEDYESLDLNEVVKIDERTATDKDKELAHREIKLEYRDKHGRLLTRKEAFRDLSYQFHGYGSGKRKEEKRLKQIGREQAEARLASRQASEGRGSGTLGALKATQKATGKAFVVHKT